jgi:hypothetical protein
MRKLRLDVNRLEVESFEVSMPADLRGTVRMHDSEEPQSIVATCDCPPPQTNHTACGQFSCGYTCTCPGTNVTCGEYTCGWHTCADSCNWCGPKDPQ